MTVDTYLAFSNEKLLFSNGVCVSPLGVSDSPSSRSLRNVVSQIDNKQDLSNYVSSFAGQVDSKGSEPKYERHPVSVTQAIFVLSLTISIDFGSNADTTAPIELFQSTTEFVSATTTTTTAATTAVNAVAERCRTWFALFAIS